MNYKMTFKRIWTALAILSLSLLVFRWFDDDSQNLQYVNLALNALLFILSLPCSIFAIPVVLLAAHYLEMNAVSSDGIILNTVLLLLLGGLQWFWIMRFWSPSEPIMQKLDLADVG
jgi:hypothetical protein